MERNMGKYLDSLPNPWTSLGAEELTKPTKAPSKRKPRKSKS